MLGQLAHASIGAAKAFAAPESLPSPAAKSLAAGPSRSEVWEALVAGRVRAHRFLQGEGRLVAELLPISAAHVRALGPLERAALELAVSTQPYKAISGDLGRTFWGARDATLRALRLAGLPTRAHAVWVGAALRDAIEAQVGLAAAPRPGGESERAGVRVTLEVTPPADLPLTPAERQIAFALARGLCNKEVAVERRTSTRTVANQIRTIGEKLDAHGRLEIVRALLG